MTTPTNNTTAGKISRIQKDERQLLSQLRDVYGLFIISRFVFNSIVFM